MKRKFLTQFINKILNFPNWVKEIIYVKLSEDVKFEDNFVYTFLTYKPILSYKGRCELDYKNSGFDVNIYNILLACAKDCSVSEIMLSNYLSMEEISSYFLMCLDEGYFEIPDNSQILNVAGFIAGKYRTGEYFANSGTISQTQLESAVAGFENRENKNKKFGKFLLDLGLISGTQLEKVIVLKEEAKKRFILDYNEVPTINPQYAKDSYNYSNEIDDLREENKKLKMKLEQILTMVKKND